MPPTEKVRLLRVLEYEFPDLATMDKHIALFAVPLQGHLMRDGVTIRSTALHPHGSQRDLFTVVQDEPADTLEPITKVGVLAGNQALALRWAKDRDDLGTYVVLRDVEQVGTCSVVIELASAMMGHPQWGALRAAAYATQTPILSVQEWEARNEEDRT